MKSLLPLLKAISQDTHDINLYNLDCRMLDFIIDSGMAAYFKYCSKSSKIDLPPEFKIKLSSAELTSKVIMITLVKSLSEVLAQLNKSSNDIVLLKGISHIQNLYPAPWYRIMSDIDILAFENDVELINKILIQLAYVPTSHNSQEYYDTHHHCMPFYNPNNNTWIEVHTALFSGNTDIKNDNIFHKKQLKRNLCKIQNSNYSDNIKQLCPELHLIYTCVHWAEDFNPIKTAIQFTDIILLVNNENINWAKINQILLNTTSASHAYLALSYLHKANILQIPDIFFSNIHFKHKNMGSLNKFILYKIIDNYFLGIRKYGFIINENNVKIIWNTLLKPKHSFVNIAYIPFNLLFPPDNKQRFRVTFIINRLVNVFNTK